MTIPTDPIRAAHTQMVANLSALVPPRITVYPTPGQFEAVRSYLEDTARIVDAMILEVGREAKSNASRPVDERAFTNVLRDALEVEALHALTREADELREARAA